MTYCETVKVISKSHLVFQALLIQELNCSKYLARDSPLNTKHAVRKAAFTFFTHWTFKEEA